MSLIKNRFELIEVIDKGQHAIIYQSIDKKKGRPCIIKLYNKDNEQSQNVYKNEVNNYKKVIDKINVKGFPQFIANGTHQLPNQAEAKFIILSRHGYDLKMLLKICGGKFSYKTAINATIEILDKLQLLHQQEYVYENFQLSNVFIPLMSDVDQTTLVLGGLGKCIKATDTLSYIDNIETLFMILCNMITGSPFKSQGSPTKKKKEKLTKLEMIRNYLSQLEEDFFSIYQFISDYQSNRKKQKKGQLQYDKTLYEGIKMRFLMISHRHQSDNTLRYDWFKILQKIQKHNRRVGHQAQGYSNLEQSLINSQSKKSKNPFQNSDKDMIGQKDQNKNDSQVGSPDKKEKELNFLDLMLQSQVSQDINQTYQQEEDKVSNLFQLNMQILAAPSQKLEYEKNRKIEYEKYKKNKVPLKWKKSTILQIQDINNNLSSNDEEEKKQLGDNSSLILFLNSNQGVLNAEQSQAQQMDVAQQSNPQYKIQPKNQKLMHKQSDQQSNQERPYVISNMRFKDDCTIDIMIGDEYDEGVQVNSIRNIDNIDQQENFKTLKKLEEGTTIHDQIDYTESFLNDYQ